MTIASGAKYEVLSGPTWLLGTRINVYIPCVDTPRQMWRKDAGDVQQFVVGDTHVLTLTHSAEPGLDAPNQIPGDWFYVYSASMAGGAR